MKSVLFFLRQQRAVLADIYKDALRNEDRLGTAQQAIVLSQLTWEMAECDEAINILCAHVDTRARRDNPALAMISADELRLAELVS